MAILEWKIQRITALLLIPIIIYLVCYLLNINNLTYSEIRTDILSPLGLIFIILASSVIYTHSAFGLVVIIEDYIHNMYIQRLMINISNFIHILLCSSTILLIFIL